MSGSLEGPLGRKSNASRIPSAHPPTTYNTHTREHLNRMRGTSSIKLNSLNFQQHIESRKRECPELYERELPDIQLLQKRSKSNVQAFQQLIDLNELPAGMICRKCLGSTDSLITQFHCQNAIQLCNWCSESKVRGSCSIRERMFQQDHRNNALVQLPSRRVVGKQIVIFCVARKSNRSRLPKKSFKSLWKFIKSSK